MRAVDVLRKKRDGAALQRHEIRFLVDGFIAGEIPPYQMSAFLMAVFLRGMNVEETVALTESMRESGSALDFGDLPGEKVDKHSTGGVGDKTSLLVAPLAASAGLFVPMITGRALGHCGGTLDKLESIPGFDCRLDEDRFREIVSRHGCAIIGQTQSIAPADRKVYALRDVTATIESHPLITASILSKKLSEGISGLILDVKAGSGAFMKTPEEAEVLARSLVDTAGRMGTKATALLTDMSQPLGAKVGNALEVDEAVGALRGEGPSDLAELSVLLTAHMLVLGKIAGSVEEGKRLAERELGSGRALEKLGAVIEAQGGDPRVVEGAGLPRAGANLPVSAESEGFVAAMETEKIGSAAMLLGAGRLRVEDSVDPAAGIVVHAKIGSRIRKGEPLATLHYNEPGGVEDAAALVREAYSLSSSPPSNPRLVLGVLEQERSL